ncbi:MAG: hypothetical protein Tsb005_01690 [Gammaproteobacteria bacterium]
MLNNAVQSVSGKMWRVNDFTGIWFSPELAQIVHIYQNQTSSQLYYETFEQTPISLIAELQPLPFTPNDQTEVTILSAHEMLLADVYYHRLNPNTSLQTYPEYSPLNVFEVLVENFNQHYAFFNVRHVDWANLVAQYRNNVTQNITQIDLFNVLKGLLAQIGDNHVNLLLSSNNLLDTDKKTEENYFGFKLKEPLLSCVINEMVERNYTNNPTDENVISKYVDDVTEAANGNIKDNYLRYFKEDPKEKITWGTMQGKPDIGYLGVLSMEFPENSGLSELRVLLNQIAQDFQRWNIHDLIIDIRFNQGGDDVKANEIMRYVISKEFVAYTTQIYYEGGVLSPRVATQIKPAAWSFLPANGRVVITTSSLTASAAEMLPLGTLSYFPDRFTLIGDETMGIHSDQFVRVLNNPGNDREWIVTLSNQRRETRDGKSYEEIGVPVDIDARLPLLNDVDKRFDGGLEKAVNFLSLNNYEGKLVASDASHLNGLSINPQLLGLTIMTYAIYKLAKQAIKVTDGMYNRFRLFANPPPTESMPKDNFKLIFHKA